MLKNFPGRYYFIKQIIIITALFIIISCDAVNVSRYYEKGGVATSAPLATEVGLQTIKSGGNAFDAAVAVGFALAVVHPQAGNIGGGGFALLRDGKTGEIDALDFRETAPASVYENMFLDSSGNQVENLTLLGAKAVGVPGTVAGLYELWKGRGKLTWENLVGIAASLADTGFIVDEKLAECFELYRNELSTYEETAEIFYPGGKSYNAGDRFVQKKLAKALYQIAAEGPDDFYKGKLADSLVATMVKYGGLITKDDLAGYRTFWREPVKIIFDSLEIYMMPPPSSGGIVVAQILKGLEKYDFSKYTPNSVDYIHLFTEVSKFAFADRSEHIGDPDYYDVPLETLLDENYISERTGQIVMDHATSSEDIQPGEIVTGESDQTTHFSIADHEGNLVSVTYTLNTNYGSKLMINGFGVLLNNEMDDFSVKPGIPNFFGLVGGEANKIEPGKRMLSSMSPTIVLNDGKPFLILGAPGGSKIISVVAQAIINFSRFNMPLEKLTGHPRFHHQWLPDILYLEEGKFDINIKQDLIKRGHNINEREPYSDLMIIHINSSGMITGASDPRGRGSFGGL